MLTLYRRHYPPCRHKIRRYRNCKCPIWVQGTLRGESIKKALDLRSWEAASDLIRGWEASGEIGVVRPEVPAVAEAVEKFIAYQKSRHLADSRNARVDVIQFPNDFIVDFICTKAEHRNLAYIQEPSWEMLITSAGIALSEG